MAVKRDLKIAASAMGRKGGRAKVPKGFSMRTHAELTELGRQGAAARWEAARARKAKGEK